MASHSDNRIGTHRSLLERRAAVGINNRPTDAYASYHSPEIYSSPKKVYFASPERAWSDKTFVTASPKRTRASLGGRSFRASDIRCLRTRRAWRVLPSLRRCAWMTLIVSRVKAVHHRIGPW